MRVSPLYLSAGSGPIELTEEAIILAEVVVQPERRFIAIEEIPIRLELIGTDDDFQKLLSRLNAPGNGVA